MFNVCRAKIGKIEVKIKVKVKVNIYMLNIWNYMSWFLTYWFWDVVVKLQQDKSEIHPAMFMCKGIYQS